MTMEKPEHNAATRLVRLLGKGGKAELARIISRDPAVVSRIVKKGVIPPIFNPVLKTYIAEQVDVRGEDWAKEAMGCLDLGTCPHCGQPLA